LHLSADEGVECNDGGDPVVEETADGESVLGGVQFRVSEGQQKSGMRIVCGERRASDISLGPDRGHRVGEFEKGCVEAGRNVGSSSAASKKMMSKSVKDGLPAAWAEGRSCRVEVVNTGSKGQGAYARSGKEQHAAAVDSVGDNL
jgi:hypothetical protein